MAVYDLEEQEKLEDLKAWWRQWGTTITAIVMVACVALAGVQGWRWWAGKQAEEASALFSGLSQAARRDVAKAKDATPRSRTVCPHRLCARAARWSGEAAVRQRRYRRRSGPAAMGDRPRRRNRAEGGRAIGWLNCCSTTSNDEALKVLDAKHGDPFAGLYADLRGDALAGPDAPPYACRLSNGALENRREVAIPQLCQVSHALGGAEALRQARPGLRHPRPRADRRRADASRSGQPAAPAAPRRR
jgi:hypothetical protein